MVIGKMTLTVKPKVKVKNEPKIKWWKLRGVEGEKNFRELVREKIGGDANQLPEDWIKTAELLRDCEGGQRNEDKEDLVVERKCSGMCQEEEGSKEELG